MDERTGQRAAQITCTEITELASAVIDGEASLDEQRLHDLHLRGCAACRAHADRLASLTRQVRLRAAEPVPDLAGRVLDRARPPRLGRGGWVRPALAWVALVIGAQSLRPLLWGDVDGASTHVARHVGAFGAALAIGLLYAAWRPHRAFGLLPFAAALSATMLIAGTLDVVRGTSTVFVESVHLVELVGVVLLWVLSGSPGLDRLGRRERPAGRLLGVGRVPSSTSR